MALMTDEPDLITKPLTPKGKGGRVVVENPPADAMNMTPDAAEQSALRMLDEADKARE